MAVTQNNGPVFPDLRLATPSLPCLNIYLNSVTKHSPSCSELSARGTVYVLQALPDSSRRPDLKSGAFPLYNALRARDE